MKNAASSPKIQIVNLQWKSNATTERAVQLICLQNSCNIFLKVSEPDNYRTSYYKKRSYH